MFCKTNKRTVLKQLVTFVVVCTSILCGTTLHPDVNKNYNSVSYRKQIDRASPFVVDRVRCFLTSSEITVQTFGCLDPAPWNWVVHDLCYHANFCR